MTEKVEPLIQRLANPGLPIHARIPIWLAVLKHLTRSGRDEIEAETLKTYTGLLAVEGFPASCFTVDSAEHVASLGEFFPVWVVLKKALSTWQFEHPDRLRITGGSGDNFLSRWMYEKVMAGCGGNPGPMLTSWLDGKIIEQ